MDELRIKRVYEEAAQDDGFRVLVDRVWPRGVSRQKANIDVWMKSVAPSTELRKWFGHDRERWDEFKSRYFDELDNGLGLGKVKPPSQKSSLGKLSWLGQACAHPQKMAN